MQHGGGGCSNLATAGPLSRLRSVLVVTVFLALVASGCRASSTIDATAIQPADATESPTVVDGDAPTSDATDRGPNTGGSTETSGTESSGTEPSGTDELDAGTSQDGSAGDESNDDAPASDTSPDTSTPGDADDLPGDDAAAPLAPAAPRLAWVLGFTDDSQWAFEATNAWWETDRPCSAAPSAGLLAIDLRASAPGEVLAYETTLELIGVPEAIAFRGDDGVVLDTCGEWPDERQRLTPVTVAANGDLVAAGPSVEVYGGDQQRWLSLAAVIAPGVATVEVALGAEDDPDGWRRELRQIDLATNETELVESVGYDESFVASSVAATDPSGRFTYRQIQDPSGRVGCEGFGVAASLAVDDGSGPRTVLGPDQPAFSGVWDLHITDGGRVAWTDGCEGYSSPWVAQMLDDGSLVDVHSIDTWNGQDTDRFVELRAFRLVNDNLLVGLGESFDSNYENAAPALEWFDLSNDPAFVESADPQPWIDRSSPLGTTRAGTGSWFIGDDPRADGSVCGASTLYASTTAGFVRAVATDQLLDPIVDLAASEPLTIDYGDGYTSTNRWVVILTECPGEGRQMWFAYEPDVPSYGLYFERADVGPVADVLSVRLSEGEGGIGLEGLAEVVYPDGTIAEIVIAPVL